MSEFSTLVNEANADPFNDIIVKKIKTLCYGPFSIKMLYFDPICPFMTGLLFLIGFCGGKTWIWKILKKLRIVLGDKFRKFSLGKIIILFVLICSLYGHLHDHFRMEEELILIFFFNYQ